MQATPEKIDEYREEISRNALKGDSYFIKFFNDANLYLGIPIIRANLSRDDDNSFDFNVFDPADKNGLITKSLRMIEFMEKR